MNDPKTTSKIIRQKNLELRKQFWPDLKEEELWNHKRRDGFIPIPRVMPLILCIMDALTERPVSSVYLDLWCRKFDEQFITLNRSQKEYAFYSGFGGQRSEQTWRERMKALVDLGFIRTESGANGPYSYVLVLNPLKVIEAHAAKHNPRLRKDYLNALSDRTNQVKAKEYEPLTAAGIKLEL